MSMYENKFLNLKAHLVRYVSWLWNKTVVGDGINVLLDEPIIAMRCIAM